MIRFIVLTAYTLGIIETIFIVIVLLNITLSSPENISNFHAAGIARQQTSLMEKGNRESQAERVVWLDIKTNNR